MLVHADVKTLRMIQSVAMRLIKYKLSQSFVRSLLGEVFLTSHYGSHFLIQAQFFKKDSITLKSGLISQMGKWEFPVGSNNTVISLCSQITPCMNRSCLKGTCRHLLRGSMERLSTRLKWRYPGAGGGPLKHIKSSILCQNLYHTVVKWWYVGHYNDTCYEYDTVILLLHSDLKKKHSKPTISCLRIVCSKCEMHWLVGKNAALLNPKLNLVMEDSFWAVEEFTFYVDNLNTDGSIQRLMARWHYFLLGFEIQPYEALS